jgi:hypothetical protein
MGLSDSLDNAQQQIKLERLEQEIQRQKAGGLYEGQNVAGRYDPILGKQAIRTPDGGVVYANPLTQAGAGEGAICQSTKAGLTQLYDLRSPNQGGDPTTAGAGLSRGGTGIPGAGIGFPGGGGGTNQPVYVPGPNGCTPTFLQQGASPPAGSFATLQECLDSLSTNKGWDCIGGACKRVVNGTGRFDTLQECEESGCRPIPGQCVAVPYALEIWGDGRLLGTIFGVGPLRLVRRTVQFGGFVNSTLNWIDVFAGNGQLIAEAGGGQFGDGPEAEALNYIPGFPEIRINRQDGQTGNCDPPEGWDPGDYLLNP